MKTDALSVIIPTYKRQEPLYETLKSLAVLKEKPLEILVCDQAREADPEKKRRVEAISPEIKYLCSPAKSLPENRNFGLENAAGEWILFLDDDIKAEAGLYEAHAQAHGGKEPGIITGRIIMPPPEKFSDIKVPVKLNMETAKYEMNWDLTRGSPADAASGGNLSGLKYVFIQANGFDSGYIGFQYHLLCLLLRHRLALRDVEV